jgi:flagellar biosynthetic protein FlhB
MAEDFDARTEEPTPKRREEARAEGRIPQSVEVTSAAVLLAALFAMSHDAPRALGAMRELLRRSLLGLTAQDLTAGQVSNLLSEVGRDGFVMVAPVLGATAVAALAATVAQVGFQLAPKRIAPEASKISPAAGLKRIFSTRGGVELVKSLAKIGLVAWITWKLARLHQDRIVPLATRGPADILAVAGGELMRVIAWSAGVLAALAAADYLWQRRQHAASLRMTRTEVKDERRQAEGDPHVKSRMKRAYQTLAKRRMLAEVAAADVVVTNPVHLAVALRYAPGEMRAPTVVAKGAEHVAERIKEIARGRGIPIVERRALARALFRSVPIGAEIPAALYRAVAEILAYIYGPRAKRQAV